MDTNKNQSLYQCIDRGVMVPMCETCCHTLAQIVHELGLDSVTLAIDADQVGFHDGHLIFAVRIRRKPPATEVLAMAEHYAADVG